MELITHESGDDLAANVAARISRSINQADGQFSLAIAGGSTPERTYKLMRRTSTEWEKVNAWLGDERWVPHGSERSNGRMANEALFDHISTDLLRPEYGPAMDPSASAIAYARTISGVHGADGRPDLILLGLGDDGHTASLFPGSQALDETEQTYVANRIPETGEARLTATYPLIHSAHLVLFMVVGENKARALAETMAGKTPASRVEDGDARVEWHVDRAAASLL